MTLGPTVIHVHRTRPLGSGVRSVWYLPDGSSIHAIEDKPIPPGTYFLRPDDTGKFQNWVIECELETRVAVPSSKFRGYYMPMRLDVEVHIGNELKNTGGCTCPGMVTTPTGVGDSRVALLHMREVLGRDTEDAPVWFLEIHE